MSYNVPVRHLQQGSVLQVASSGTISVQSGASLVLDAGAVFSAGGTVTRWAFGTAAITSGVGTVATGLSRVVSANANPVLGEAQSAGSVAFVYTDLSLSGAGSVIFRLGSVGGALWAANGTIGWQAFGS